MKKLLTILAALISLATYSQGVKISAMPTLTDPAQVAVSYFPVIYPVPPYTNYKALGSVIVAGVNTRIDSVINNRPIVQWGDITGTLSNQTDLWTVLESKADKTTTLTINGETFDLSADRTWTISTSGGGIQSIEGNNGVTVLTDSVVQLGSTSNSGVPLTTNRFVNTSTFTLNFRGSSANDVVDVITTHATAYALKADAVGGAAIRAANAPADVTTIKPVIEVVRAGSGTSSVGAGTSIDYYTWIDNTNGSTYNGTVASKWTNITYATRSSNLEFFAVNSAVTNNVVTMEGGGNVKLNITGKGYAAKSPDGTVWYLTVNNSGVGSWSTSAP